MKYILSALITVIFTQHALAAEQTAQAEGWSPHVAYITWQGTGVKSDLRGKRIPIEAIYSGNAETEGDVAFSCYIKSYAASFAPGPVDLEDVLGQVANTGQVKLRRPDIKINGEKMKRTDWIYLCLLYTSPSPRDS